VVKMEIVIKKRDMILLAPNERYTVPDEIGQKLIDRGSAEDITKVAEEMKESEHKKEKKEKKGGQLSPSSL
jgi:hypothetical protein